MAENTSPSDRNRKKALKQSIANAAAVQAQIQESLQQVRQLTASWLPESPKNQNTRPLNHQHSEEKPRPPGIGLGYENGQNYFPSDTTANPALKRKISAIKDRQRNESKEKTRTIPLNQNLSESEEESRTTIYKKSAINDATAIVKRSTSYLDKLMEEKSLKKKRKQIRKKDTESIQ
ncbi:hypothetical protein NEOLI_000623 [Neolecta irregularis DAH-3]|uniref:Uncharacterized protein n=1 Tax=Neolecta irregularis (strain DAH-3) TaxID=1198029 RepID=A0A1U7LTX5_NEOID|nr:hypothetical protein NEOLI_000623 [Neolecta irregularis DAH-3]|eukprot:OLL26117.1 hypothetical protein NEOLI_000623 [Neolecta irregularis DAH-3]